MDDEDLVWEGIPADEVDRLLDQPAAGRSQQPQDEDDDELTRGTATPPTYPLIGKPKISQKKQRREPIGVTSSPARKPSSSLTAQVQQHPGAGGVQWDAEIRLENDRLKEELRNAQIANAALLVEVTDAKWATGRAVELGSSLATIVDERDQLKHQVETLTSRLKELEDLDKLQQFLIQEWDLQEVIMQSNANSMGAKPKSKTKQTSQGKRSETAQPNVEASGGSGIVKSAEQLQEETRQIQEQLKKRILYLGSRSFSKHSGLMSGGPDRCLQCLVHSEEKHRGELFLLERNIALQFQCIADGVQSQERYVNDQLVEVELRQMWEEDLRSHDVQLWEAHRRVADHNKVLRQLRHREAEVDHWRAKYKDLKEAGKKHVQELHLMHKDELKATRLAYLRCNPNMVFTEWLAKSTERLHRFYTIQCLALASTQRELATMKSEMQWLRVSFVEQIQATAREVDSALRRCLPIVWDPVRNERRQKARKEQEREDADVEKDQLQAAQDAIADYRPVVVAASPIYLQETSSRSPKPKSKRVTVAEDSSTPQRFSIGSVVGTPAQTAATTVVGARGDSVKKDIGSTVAAGAALGSGEDGVDPFLYDLEEEDGDESEGADLVADPSALAITPGGETDATTEHQGFDDSSMVIEDVDVCPQYTFQPRAQRGNAGLLPQPARTLFGQDFRDDQKKKAEAKTQKASESSSVVPHKPVSRTHLFTPKKTERPVGTTEPVISLLPTK